MVLEDFVQSTASPCLYPPSLLYPNTTGTSLELWGDSNDSKPTCWQNSSELISDNFSSNVSDIGKKAGLSPSYFCRVMVTCIFVCIIIIGTIGNISVVVVVRRTPVLRTWENALHINLAIIDLLTCLFVVIPIAGFYWTGYDLESHALKVYKYTVIRASIWSPTANIINLTEISLLRSLRIRHPTYYISQKKYIFGIVLPWFIGFLLAVISLTTNQASVFFVDRATSSSYKAESSLAIILGICSIILIVNYTLVFKKLYQQRRAIAPYAGTYTINRIDTNVDESTHSSAEAIFHVTLGHNIHYAHIVHKNQDVIMTSIIILVVYICTTFPAVLVYILGIILPMSQGLYDLTETAAAVYFVNSFVNPYIYAYRNPVFKKQFKKVFKCTRKKDENYIENFI